MSMLNMARNRILRHCPPAVRLFRECRDFYLHRDSQFEKLRADCLETVRDMTERPFAMLQAEHEQQAYDEGYPTRAHMTIEINNTCNIDCLMCKTSLSTRRKGTISSETLESAAQQAKKHGVRYVELHTIGDPLANPRLRDVLRIFRRYGLRVGISTNGLLLYRHLDTLLEFRDVCSGIWFSIDGATPSTYEKIRAGGKWDELLRNMELAWSRLRPGGYDIRIGMVVSADNIGEVGLFIERFRSYVRAPHSRLQFAFVSSLSPDNQYFHEVNLFRNHTALNVPCRQVVRPSAHMLVDGRVTVCSRDYDGSLVIGNLADKPLEEILVDRPMKTLQEAHRVREVAAYPLCQTCFLVDTRLGTLFNGLLSYLLFNHPTQRSDFYQERVDRFVQMFQHDDYSGYPTLFH